MSKKLLIFLLLILLGAILSAYLLTLYQLRKPVSRPANDISHEEIQQKGEQKNEKLVAWIDKLAQCESSNNPHVIVDNDGGSPSYGLLQWKYDSFWRYNKKYKILPDLEYQEVANVIMDEEVQRKLAEEVIKNESNGWRNWYKCAKKIGLDKLEGV